MYTAAIISKGSHHMLQVSCHHSTTGQDKKMRFLLNNLKLATKVNLLIILVAKHEDEER